MDNTNYNDVLQLSEKQEHRKKVQLILNELFPNENVDVPDPYYGLQNGFDSVYQMLNEACDLIAKKLIEKHT
jgi:protein-tyrosine phosphatase